MALWWPFLNYAIVQEYTIIVWEYVKIRKIKIHKFFYVNQGIVDVSLYKQSVHINIYALLNFQKDPCTIKQDTCSGYLSHVPHGPPACGLSNVPKWQKMSSCQKYVKCQKIKHLDYGGVHKKKIN